MRMGHTYREFYSPLKESISENSWAIFDALMAAQDVHTVLDGLAHLPTQNLEIMHDLIGQLLEKIKEHEDARPT
jgi:hypothetical protein